jgi:hypothetical protein
MDIRKLQAYRTKIVRPIELAVDRTHDYFAITMLSGTVDGCIDRTN